MQHLYTRRLVLAISTALVLLTALFAWVRAVG
jgi:hypothetical protein